MKIQMAPSKKFERQDSIFCSFDYNQDIVNVFRQEPSRIWHGDTKEWEVPVRRLSAIIQACRPLCDTITVTGEFKDTTAKLEIPEGFEMKTNPYPHQVEGFEYGMVNDKWILGDEQGLGKTKQIIDIAAARRVKLGYSHCLIICGVNNLKWNWAQEIETHSDESYWVLGQRRNKRGAMLTKGNKEKLADLSSPDVLSNYFLVTNVESLRSEELLSALINMIDIGQIDMVAIDEVHKVKNPASQQGKAILKLCNALPAQKCCIPMSGTPYMNRPMDLYVPLKMVGVENHSFYKFKQHYCQYGGYGGYEVVGYKNLDQLQEQLNTVMLRRLKKDVLDLPEKIRVLDIVEMGKPQEKIYQEVFDSILEDVDKIKMSNNPLASLIRLRQATGYPGILSSSVQESIKLDRMEEYVEDAVEEGRKVIIFSNWTSVTDVAYDRLKKYNPALITGQLSGAEQKTQEAMFQTDPECHVVIGTIAAMGTGITLTAASLEIFLDEPWNRAVKDQAEDRAHRIGTIEPLEIVTICAKDTIDMRIYNLVQKKGGMSDLLVDGDIGKVDRATLDYLLS